LRWSGEHEVSDSVTGPPSMEFSRYPQRAFNMPPIPTTYDDETKNLIESIQRRQKDLSEFQIPRLRDCRQSLAVQQNLAAELREDVDTVGKQIEVSIAAASLYGLWLARAIQSGPA
jgi:hypothetical protein